MANIANVGLVTTANTFDYWRIQSNMTIGDVNEICRGDFVKQVGDVTISEGILTLANSSGGVILDVADDTNIDGTLTVFNIQVDNSTNHIYSNARDVWFRRMDTSAYFWVNTNASFWATNVSVSNSTVGTLNVNNQLVTINTNLLTVANTQQDAKMNVYSNTFMLATNVTISNTEVGGTFNVASNSMFTPSNVTISNTQVGGTFNVASNTMITASNVVISNTQVGGTFNVASNTMITASNVTIANTQVGGTLNVASNTRITASNVVISNTDAGGTFNVASNTTITASNVTISNTQVGGTFNVASNTMLTASNVTVSNTVSGTFNVDTVYVSVSSPTINLTNTHASATFNIAPNTYFQQNGNVAGNININSRLEVGGISNLYSNVNVAANVYVKELVNTSNLVVRSLANIANANVINATITTLTVIDPIQAPALSADSIYVLRYGATTDGNGVFRIQRSVASGNAEIFWNDITNTFEFYEGSDPATRVKANTSLQLKTHSDYLVTDTCTGATTVDLSISNWFKYTLAGSSTFTFANAPVAGQAATVTLILVQGTGGGKTVSWGNTIYWAGGQVPPATTTAAGNTDVWTLTTYDGGSTFIGTLAVKNAR